MKSNRQHPDSHWLILTAAVRLRNLYRTRGYGWEILSCPPDRV